MMLDMVASTSQLMLDLIQFDHTFVKQIRLWQVESGKILKKALCVFLATTQETLYELIND